MKQRWAPKAVLFDWDNTLADNWGAIHRAINAALSAMGHSTWTREETRERVRRSLRDSFPEMFGDRWEEARDIFYSTFREVQFENLGLCPGAANLLDALDRAGIPYGVVSNKTGDLLRAEAAHLGWTGRFAGAIVGAGDAAHDKPAPDPVHLALAPLAMPPAKSVWFVGDAAIDIECARAAGLSAALVGMPHAEADRIEMLAPELRVADCLELAQLVDE